MRRQLGKASHIGKLGSININKFITDCDLLNISLSDVDDMVNAFNTQVKKFIG